MSDKSSEIIPDTIAVIGMSGRFPGAANVQQLWANLCNAKESVTFFTEEELREAGIDETLLKDPHYVRAAAMVDGVQDFAASFFGFTAQEAELMDPQHRVFIECAWEAMEDAGHVPERFPGRIGVYAGAGLNTYMFNLMRHQELLESMGMLQMAIGNLGGFMPTKVSYKLNLNGPSVNVNTACSTSLVAVHMACRSLLNYESDMVLAGGVTIEAMQKKGYLYQPGGVLSADGHCRAFDANSQGTVSGNGAGVVVLRRLDDAVADGDHIYAVIRGSAINNDGAQKVGYTAPSVNGQQEVIELAMAMAEVQPQTIGYVEAHGTGTTLGDPIEVEALKRAFRTGTDRCGYCAIGSVKSNIGHLDAAAGVAGLIKTALCLSHRTLVPSLHYEQSNPGIDFPSTPFFVNTSLREWQPLQGSPRRAGVSAFGIGGTNAHVVLEETPVLERSDSQRGWYPLLLSAQTESALEAATDRLAQALSATPDICIADVAYTLQVGRKGLDHRRVILCRDATDAVQVIAHKDTRRLHSHHASPRDPAANGVVFMFPGMGEQYPLMTAGLYQEEPAFRQAVERCALHLQPLLGVDLRELMYPKEMSAPRTDTLPDPSGGFDLRKMLHREAASQEDRGWTRESRWVHPVLFTVEYALAQVLLNAGIRPTAMIGHSLGEYVAACLAGVISLEDALTLVAKRAQLIQALPEGGMLAVALSGDVLGSELPEGLSVAAVNGPTMTVVAGPVTLVEAFEARMGQRGVACLPVQSAHAFHSSMLWPLREPLKALFEGVTLRAPSIPYLSNLTGTWITADQAVDPSQWVRHTCETVRFGDGIDALCARGIDTFLEVGPGQTLCSFVQQHSAVQGSDGRIAMPVLPGMHEQSSDGFVLAQTLGLLWCQGHTPDWSSHHRHEHRRRVPLPTYPFERQRCWLEAPAQAGGSALALPEAKSCAVPRSTTTTLLHRASWTSDAVGAGGPAMVGPQDGASSQGSWLIFQGDEPTTRLLVKRLAQRGIQTVVAVAGEAFSRLGESTFTMRPDAIDDHRSLLSTLNEGVGLPCRVLHMVSLCPQAQAHAMAYASLLCLAKTFGTAVEGRGLEVVVVSRDAYTVVGDEQPSAEAAALHGPCMVLPLEFASMRCCQVDFSHASSWPDSRWVDAILGEVDRGLPSEVVVYRGRRRWTRTFEAVVPPTGQAPVALRQGGVYLLEAYRPSGVCQGVAEYLAKSLQATLLLRVDRALPPRHAWETAFEAPDTEVSLREWLRSLLTLESLGATLVIIEARESAPFRAAIDQWLAAGTGVNGVFCMPPSVELGLVQLEPEARPAVLEAQLQRLLDWQYAGQALEPEFVVVLTSNVGLAGSVGQLGCCATSAVMVSQAESLADALSRPVMCMAMDLDDFGEGGPGTQGLPAPVADYLHTTRRRYAIGKSSLAQVLPAMLHLGEPFVVVSTSPVTEVMREIREATLPSIVHKMRLASESRARSKRPAFVALETEIEQQVAAFWTQLLGAQEIGRDDSFFHLGGNSLLAVQFISRIRETFQVDLPLRSLFQAQTVGEVSARVEDLLLQEIEALSDEEAQALMDIDTPAPTTWGEHESTPYQLPNGLVVQQFNAVETQHFFHDIFESQVYYRNGIVLDKDSVVLDVGANVGLFSLFAHRQSGGARIYAFEPAPPVFGALQRNMAEYGVDAQVFNCGVSDRVRKAQLTYYPNSTGMSSFHADKEEEKEVLMAIMQNQLNEGIPGMTQVMAHVDDILEERFKTLSYECELTTVSEIIRTQGLSRIDLLKIDVQKSELDVIQGIDPAHWALIRQVVVEVHDLNGRVQKVSSLLAAQGFRVVVEQELLYRSSNISNVYGIRA